MIEVNELITRTIKKEIFNENDGLNKAARQVLSEMKTKFKDLKEEITSEVQNKILMKMKKDRENSIQIYREAVDKAGTNNAFENLKKEKAELDVINLFLSKLSFDLPKQISDEKVVELINENGFSNIGECMKWFSKNYPNQDKRNINRLFNGLKR